jgi:hypothetical protein
MVGLRNYSRFPLHSLSYDCWVDAIGRESERTKNDSSGKLLRVSELTLITTALKAHEIANHGMTVKPPLVLHSWTRHKIGEEDAFQPLSYGPRSPGTTYYHNTNVAPPHGDWKVYDSSSANYYATPNEFPELIQRNPELAFEYFRSLYRYYLRSAY